VRGTCYCRRNLRQADGPPGIVDRRQVGAVPGRRQAVSRQRRGYRVSSYGQQSPRRHVTSLDEGLPLVAHSIGTAPRPRTAAPSTTTPQSVRIRARCSYPPERPGSCLPPRLPPRRPAISSDLWPQHPTLILLPPWVTSRRGRRQDSAAAKPASSSNGPTTASALGRSRICVATWCTSSWVTASMEANISSTGSSRG
jgi:hypothetical protein